MGLMSELLYSIIDVQCLLGRGWVEGDGFIKAVLNNNSNTKTVAEIEIFESNLSTKMLRFLSFLRLFRTIKRLIGNH